MKFKFLHNSHYYQFDGNRLTIKFSEYDVDEWLEENVISDFEITDTTLIDYFIEMDEIFSFLWYCSDSVNGLLKYRINLSKDETDVATITFVFNDNFIISEQLFYYIINTYHISSLELTINDLSINNKKNIIKELKQKVANVI